MDVPHSPPMPGVPEGTVPRHLLRIRTPKASEDEEPPSPQPLRLPAQGLLLRRPPPPSANVETSQRPVPRLAVGVRPSTSPALAWRPFCESFDCCGAAPQSRNASDMPRVVTRSGAQKLSQVTPPRQQTPFPEIDNQSVRDATNRILLTGLAKDDQSYATLTQSRSQRSAATQTSPPFPLRRHGTPLSREDHAGAGTIQDPYHPSLDDPLFPPSEYTPLSEADVVLRPYTFQVL